VEEWPAYTANLCRIRRGGAASHSRPHTIILHNESGDGKRFFLYLITNLLGPPPDADSEALFREDNSNEKKK